MTGKYVDFSVTIEGAGEGCRVRASSPRAEAENLTRFAFDLEALNEQLRSSISHALPGPQVRNPAGVTPSSPALKQIGEALFATLLPGEVGALYHATWSEARRERQGVRIRLHLRPRSPELAWLTRVPWELLFDAQAGCFPGLNPSTPLVRHLDLPRPAERAPLRLPLQVLVVAANPAELAKLELKREQAVIREASRGQVEVLEDPELEDLRRELRRARYQIVHFMGHGWIDSAAGGLVFSTAEGGARPVTGDALSHLFQGCEAPALALLNACDSAAVPTAGDADPLAGVAGALVQGGMSAVVGMQFAISDRAAIAFSRVLYAALADGDPVEAAVAEARLALHAADPNASDWIAPILFLRGAEQPAGTENVTKKTQEKDVIFTSWEGDRIKSDRISITGEIGDVAGPDRTSGRPREVITKLKVGTAEAKDFTFIGSDRRTAK
jgi:hypothetical protein